MSLIVIGSHKQWMILDCLLSLAFGNLLCPSAVLILIPRDRFADCGGKGSGTGHGVGQGMQAVYLLHVRVVPFLLAMVSNSRGEYSLLSPSTHIHREWVSGLEGGGVLLFVEYGVLVLESECECTCN